MPRWHDFLRGGEPSGHGVQIYSDVGELADSVAAYLAAGFERGDPGLLIAAPEHAERYFGCLAASGWDATRIEAAGLLVVSDAEQTLDALMVGDDPSADAFEEVVGTLLDRIAEQFPRGRTRAFGEMVNVLCERGLPEAAVRLEELWNAVVQQRGFSLLCGYRLNLFDRASQVELLPHVCESHSHVLPAADSARLARAVDRALEEVLGAQAAGKVYVVVGSHAPDSRVPMPQQILMWVSANMPSLAERILESARTHYTVSPAASS